MVQEKLSESDFVMEYEKKVILSAAEYKSLISLLGINDPVKRQVHYCFDTEDFCEQEKW